MKKTTINLIVLLITGVNIFAQKIPVLSPLNPDFVDFVAKMNNQEYPLPDSDSFGTGGMPPPGLVSFDDYMDKNNLKSATFAPLYDMRTTGLLTPVRGQTSNGCWAYATIASVESKWLVMGLGAWDLSENNLKYCHGFDPSRSYYGNHWMSTAYFARRSGALIESDDPNTGGSTVPGECPTGKIPVAYITDARYLPHDMNTIKQAILDQGAIFTMIYYCSTYYNASNYTYYYSGATSVNHCIDLVGWDDSKVTAGGTGAWICKNSYGPGWGEAGFFYVSYNDKSILNYNAYWPNRCANVANSKIYGYDDLGNYQSVGYGSDVGYTLVKFVATGKQLLSKVGTYAMAANSILDIEVFDNFNTVTKTLSGLLSQQTGLVCSMPGYYTFDLSSPVAIEQGNDFYIRVRYKTPSYNNPIPIERLISGYSVPFIESDIAWVSDNGADGSWFLIGNSTSYYKWDPCIKVYAESVASWTGTVSGDWNTAANWSPEIVPGDGITVIIPDVANKPVIDEAPASPALCNNLTILEGSALTVNPGKALTVTGTLNNLAGNNGLVLESGSSLITGGAVNGPATINRNIAGGEWHLISSPVSDAVSSMFTGKYLQKFDEATDKYLDIISESEKLAVFSGYAVFNAAPFTATFTGKLNSGQLGDNANLSNGGLGWNLVGNPYPSFINWDANGWTKSNVSNAIYLPLNSSTWASYVDGIGTNGGSPIISPGQGFFVHVAESGSGTLAMNNSIRVHSAASFFKTQIDRLIRLKVTGNGYSDETVVRFLDDATTGFDDAYDAIKFFGDVDEAAQLYTQADVPLSINSLPETNSVNVGIRVNTSGVFTIAASEANGFAEIMMEDTKTGLFTDMLKTAYSFNVIPGENEQRFVLHFSPLSISEAENPAARIYSSSRTVYVDLNTIEKGDICIYNIAGQLIAKEHSVMGMNKIQMAGSGTYIVKLIEDKYTIVRKIYVH